MKNTVYDYTKNNINNNVIKIDQIEFENNRDKYINMIAGILVTHEDIDVGERITVDEDIDMKKKIEKSRLEVAELCDKFFENVNQVFYIWNQEITENNNVYKTPVAFCTCHEVSDINKEWHIDLICTNKTMTSNNAAKKISIIAFKDLKDNGFTFANTVVNHSNDTSINMHNGLVNTFNSHVFNSKFNQTMSETLQKLNTLEKNLINLVLSKLNCSDLKELYTKLKSKELNQKELKNANIIAKYKKLISSIGEIITNNDQFDKCNAIIDAYKAMNDLGLNTSNTVINKTKELLDNLFISIAVSSNIEEEVDEDELPENDRTEYRFGLKNVDEVYNDIINNQSCDESIK